MTYATSPAKAGCAVSDDGDYVVLHHLIVFEPEEPEQSGLLDPHGNPLVRQREPIGFLRYGS